MSPPVRFFSSMFSILLRDINCQVHLNIVNCGGLTGWSIIRNACYAAKPTDLYLKFQTRSNLCHICQVDLQLYLYEMLKTTIAIKITFLNLTKQSLLNVPLLACSGAFDCVFIRRKFAQLSWNCVKTFHQSEHLLSMMKNCCFQGQERSVELIVFESPYVDVS